MRTPIALITIGLALLIPAAASASLSGEQRQGQNLIAQIQAGARTCRGLSANDLDHIGEYLMFRALGSTSLHQAMNDRMIAMLGEQGESRMHQLLGARYAGCSTSSSGSSGYRSMMGGGAMMGGYSNHGGLGATMSSANWSWMMNSTWQHMTRQDWRRLQHQLLGANSNTPNHGWSMAALMAAILGGILLVTLAIVAVIRRQLRRPPVASPSQ